ncbi:PQQ-dependent sugar dehydrogenase, partial [Pseudomonas nitroreducens]
INTDGSGRRIFAKGLRNTIGFDWHPLTKEMYGFDHGIDWLGDEQQREELNLLKEGADYGWPYIFESGKFNVAEEAPPGMTFAEYASKTTPPVQLYTAHASPLGLVFYTGEQFPAEYRNDAFVTMRGSWNRSEPAG